MNAEERKNFSKKQRARSAFNMANTYVRSGLYGDAKVLYNRALDNYEELGDNDAVKNCYRKLRLLKKRVDKGDGRNEPWVYDKVALIVLSFVISALLLSSNFTGYTIANIPQMTSNGIGGFFLIVGVLVSYFYIKRIISA
jgi:hypothetical protein